jgi:hypothetical protein
MKKAMMRLPAKLEPRRCWIGSYGGHFNVIVVFNQKPVKGDEGEYDVHTNKNIIAGSFDQEQFNLWFGTNIEPDATEIKKVECYTLTAIWNEYGQIYGLDTNYD